MNLDVALVGILGIIVIVGAAAFSRRLGVAAPLILVAIGIGYSFVPGVPEVVIEPEVLLTGVLPLLLYAAAIQVPVVDFRRNLGPIAALSVLLVVVSAVIVGLVLSALLPGLGLAAALALGAVVSPPDVVAATSIGKRLGLPPRLLAVIEGEGLVNDATALVMLRTAVAAMAASAAGSLGLAGAVGEFVYALVVALLVGLAVGVAAVWVRRRLDQPILDTVISFAVPFLAFLPTEELGGSGVIAVVAAGLYSGHQSARLSPPSRIAERLNWRTVQFVLENGVFLLMGAQLAGIVAEIRSEDLAWHGAVGLGVLVSVVLVVVRFSFVWPLLAGLARLERRAQSRSERLERFAERARRRAAAAENPREARRWGRFLRRADQQRNDLAQLREEGFGWRGAVVLGWAGMRGVVTLAAAQSLPRDTPFYEQLVLIAFTVAIVTLMTQGVTLPLLIRVIGIRGTDRAADRRELAMLLDEMEEAGMAALDGAALPLPGGATVDPAIVERVRTDTALAAQAAWERAEHAHEVDGILDSPHQQYRDLRREVLRAEREVLLDARSRGAYPSRILQRAQALLDLEEARLEQMDSGGRE